MRILANIYIYIYIYIYNIYKESLPIHPSFFNKFWPFDVNSSIRINCPKENDKKD